MFKDSAITLMTQLMILAISITTSIIISRALGPTLKGAFSIFILIFGMVSMTMTFGLGASVVYLGAQDKARIPSLTGNGLLAALVTGTVGAILVEGMLQLPVFRNYLYDNHLDEQWLHTALFILPSLLIQSFLVEVLRANGDMIRYNLTRIFRITLNLMGVLILVWAWPMHLAGAIIAWEIAIVLTMLLTMFWAIQSAAYKVRINLPILKEMVRFGIKLYPGNLMQFLNYRLDVFLVSFLLGSKEVGLYVTATALAEKLWQVPHALRTVLIQRVAASQNRQLAEEITARTARMTLAMMIVAGLIFAVLAFPLISFLYGQAFIPSAPALILLLPGIVTLSAGKVLAAYLSGVGHPEGGTYGAGGALVATIILDLLLIPWLGLNGAAIASSLAYIVSALFIFLFFLTHSETKAINVLLIQRDDLALLFTRFRNTISTKNS